MAASIQDLPPEILEIIFKNLSLVDVENASRTCVKWREISAHFFFKSRLQSHANLDEEMKNILRNEGWTEDCYDTDLIVTLYEKFLSLSKAKVLIATGYPCENGQKTEIIDLSNPKFKCEFLADNLKDRWGCVGSLLQGQPIICGGKSYFDYFKECLTIGKPNIKMNMLQKRSCASSVVLNKDTLWVVGGWDSPNSLNTSEFVTLNQAPSAGPGLPFTITGHGMVKYNDNSIYIIGGFQDGSRSKETWIVNPKNGFEIVNGPKLNQERSSFSCGKMEVNGKILIVIAGGEDRYGFGLDSVEILEPLSNQGWKSGPKLPLKLGGSAMVTSPSGKGVVVIGGWKNSVLFGESSNALIELKGNSMEWVTLEQKLKYAREGHVAIPIS